MQPGAIMETKLVLAAAHQWLFGQMVSPVPLAGNRLDI
jgi:hypothetical protein